MPGYDGTGPRGRGPMTGRGDGYCMIEVPYDPDQPGTGFVGLPGRPVMVPANSVSPQIIPACVEIARTQKTLLDIERDLEDLRVAARRPGGPDRNAAPGDTPTSSDGGML
jgi:hypothetical protein